MGSGTYHGEEEEEEEEEEGEEAEENRKKTKEDPTPLWKYVTRQEGTRGGGTKKFVFPHCKKDIHRFIYPCEKTSMWEHAM